MTANEWRRRERVEGVSTTEESWRTCPAPDYLLFHILQVALETGRRLSERKLRLFGCACCRLVWNALEHPASRVAVESAEKFADGLVAAPELHQACETATAVVRSYGEQVPRKGEPGRDDYAREAPLRAASSVARFDDGWAYRTHIDDILDLVSAATEFQPFGLVLDDVDSTLCAMLRDVFGNPFHPVTFAPEWRTSTVVSLAQQMYDQREFGPMPILADALQDAGCADENVLSHCRGPGPHVRGCWVVDLVLGRE